MPFTAPERERFIGVLRTKGWTLEEDTVWSPSRGLYFNGSHFQHWSPREMREVFVRRGERIQKTALEGWESFVAEHRDVCSAAEEVLGA